MVLKFGNSPLVTELQTLSVVLFAIAFILIAIGRRKRSSALDGRLPAATAARITISWRVGLALLGASLSIWAAVLIY